MKTGELQERIKRAFNVELGPVNIGGPHMKVICREVELYIEEQMNPVWKELKTLYTLLLEQASGETREAAVKCFDELANR